MGFLDDIVEGGLGKPVFGKSIHSFLHPEEAYEKAAEEYRKQYEEARRQSQGYIDPYNQHGLDQYGTLNQGIQSLMNPEQLMGRFALSYETSPYAQRMLEMNKGAGLDAASSMGLNGSSAALGNIQQGAGDIVSKEREQYLKMMMAQYLEGLGLSQNMYNTGANLAGNYAGNLLGQGNQYGQGMAQMAFGQERAPGNLFGQFLRAGANMYGGGQMGGGGGGFLS
jgi:hypothetical protein